MIRSISLQFHRGWSWLRADGWRQIVARLWAPLALYAALVVLRHELVRDMGYTYEQAFASGLWRGLYFDFLVTLYATLVAQLFWALFRLSKRISWPTVAFFIWFASLANVLHYKFFGIRLDWWIVRFHWSDLFVVQGSAVQLGQDFAVIASCVLIIVAVLLAAMPRWVGLRPALPPPGSWWRSRLGSLGWTAAILLACVTIWRAPRYLGGRKGTTVLSDNVVRAWISQTTSRNTYAGAGRGWYAELANDATPDDPSRANRVLAAYQRFVDPGWNSSGDLAPKIPGDKNTWPLLRELTTDTAQTRALRQRLGLPVGEPIHIILLFLESVRAFEVLHPEMGPRILPSLRRILAEHAIFFRQAYSSSFTAGQTVRGQFSTLCSMLPNITGAATYIAHSTVGTRCIQQLLKENGYETAWMNSHRAMYHNKKPFEMLHGTHLFFEKKDLLARGVDNKIVSWGLADENFLLEVVEILEELAEAGKPVFANVLTISAHHPYSFVKGGELPADVQEETRSRLYYQKYLSRLKYEDRALASFFTALFASPIARNTLVVLTADHSSPVRPHYSLTHRQIEEIRFRVPIAFITRDIPAPEAYEYPVHQVDIAPAIAHIAGIGGSVTWVGRDPFSGQGTPWVYVRDKQLMFRTNRRGCYPKSDKGAMQCFDVEDRDPMFDRDLEAISVDPTLNRFFHDVVLANMQAIVLNRVRPR
jgi:hypothetical protein